MNNKKIEIRLKGHNMGDIQQRVAVKIVLVNDEDQVLLLRKSQDNVRHAGNSGLWNLPGGKINPGETILDAISREASE